ncbi:MAG: hypothetical protein HQL72_02405 [Magnetococcales bacterium]|nr:hypothetical protein [Magnetococcales bacterium]
MNLESEVEPKESPVEGGSGAGVGGRQEDTSSPLRGGGYQDICTILKPDPGNDPRIRELKQLGLNPCWIEIAETVGYEDFLKIWRILDRKNLHTGGRENSRITIPLFSRLVRQQRNQVLRTMAAEGATLQELIACSVNQFGMSITWRSVYRILMK